MFTVTALKEKLRQIKLSTSGNKAELILRLNQADSTGQWICDLDAETEAGAAGNDTTVEDAEIGAREPRLLYEQSKMSEKELELSRRENELLRREVEVMRLENELLRRGTPVVPANNTNVVMAHQVSLSNLKEMLPVFDGRKRSYRGWREQLLLIKQMYRLDDGMTKLLLGAKLIGDAAEWFHSVPTHLSLPVDELLRRMEAMYDRRERRLTLRKEFENKMWQQGETFAEHFHKKLILANKVPIEEEEIVDYLIDGIPVKSIKHQALMQQFRDKETMLRAMENVSLGTDQKIQAKADKQGVGKNVNKASGVKKMDNDLTTKRELKCFNCNVAGHISTKCTEPKREKGACFKCFQLGHKAKDCPSKNSTKAGDVKGNEENKEITSTANINSVIETTSPSRSACETSANISNVGAIGIRDFHRDVNYQLSDDKNDFVLACKLDTLLDTGSPISFIKNNFVPQNLIEPTLTGDDKYQGLINSKLKVKGRVKVKLALNDREAKCVSLLVVPDTSMKSSVIIGRDVLRQFFEKKISNNREVEDEAIRELLNIEIHDPIETARDCLNINPEIRAEVRDEMQKLFIADYVKPQRPDQRRLMPKLG